VPELCRRVGFPRQTHTSAVGVAFGLALVAQPAADSLLGQVLSGTQAQGRIGRGEVATPALATDSAVEQGLEVGVVP
jgi:hypothetical protein